MTKEEIDIRLEHIQFICSAWSKLSKSQVTPAMRDWMCDAIEKSLEELRSEAI